MQQVHVTERHFGNDVYPAQGWAEFDAIEDHQMPVHPGQIRQMQVAVTFAHPASQFAFAHQGRKARLFGIAPVLQVRQKLPLRRFIQPLRQQLKVFRDGLGDPLRFTPRAVGGGALTFDQMEMREARGQRVYLLITQFAPFRQLVERRVSRKLAHFYSIFKRLPCTIDTRCDRTAGDGDTLQIIVRRQPPVQAQLFHTVLMAQFQRTEIEKSQIDRLLDLVGKRTRKQYPGNMRLDQLQLCYRMVVTDRIGQQRMNQRRQYFMEHRRDSPAKFLARRANP